MHAPEPEEEFLPSESTSEVFKKKLAPFSFQGNASSTPTKRTQQRTPTQTPSFRRSPRNPWTDPTDPIFRPKPRSPKPKVKRGFAPADQYQHLKPLPDYLVPNLDIVFCGINPGQKSAEIGHHFGGPTNHFWPCLYESGLTNVRLRPTEDSTLPDRFAFGMTNLVGRPTAEQNELSKTELSAAVPALLNKIALYRPRIVCVIGLGIAKIIKSDALHKPPKKKGEKQRDPPSFGLQPFKLVYDTSDRETLFFAVSSTSGRVVRYHKAHKVEQFKELKSLLEKITTGQFDSSRIYAIQQPT